VIILVETPQRADIKAEYTVDNDTLTVTMGETTENFDFTGLPDGITEEVKAKILPVNPIVYIEKVDNTTKVTVIRFYDEDEKALFETAITSHKDT